MDGTTTQNNPIAKVEGPTTQNNPIDTVEGPTTQNDPIASVDGKNFQCPSSHSAPATTLNITPPPTSTPTYSA